MYNEIEQLERPEPFTTVLDLVSEHGPVAIIDSLGRVASAYAKDTEHSEELRGEAAYLSMELYQLLTRYTSLFPEPEEPEEPEQQALRFYPTAAVEV